MCSSLKRILLALGQGADTLDQLFAQASVALSSEMLGSAQTAFEMTLEYLKVREQFGAKIGVFS